MKQIVVISGKGGTGKTVITASFAALAKNKVMADCDVDAADLHLLLEPNILEQHRYTSGRTAVIDRQLCQQCGKCVVACRFNAIGPTFVVDAISCEGCAFCSYICPVKAIDMQENLTGEWFISDTRFGPFVHARLGIAEENSGKLVSLVRKQAQELAKKKNADWVIIDGAPGIGCPVIASMSGIDLVLIVTEPTVSGVHDLERVLKLAQQFKVPALVCINKFDLNPAFSGKIAEVSGEYGATVAGQIPFNPDVVKALSQGKTVIEQNCGDVTDTVINIWETLKEKLADLQLENKSDD